MPTKIDRNFVKADVPELKEVLSSKLAIKDEFLRDNLPIFKQKEASLEEANQLKAKHVSSLIKIDPKLVGELRYSKDTNIIIKKLIVLICKIYKAVNSYFVSKTVEDYKACLRLISQLQVEIEVIQREAKNLQDDVQKAAGNVYYADHSLPIIKSTQMIASELKSLEEDYQAIRATNYPLGKELKALKLTSSESEQEAIDTKLASMKANEDKLVTKILELKKELEKAEKQGLVPLIVNKS
jgi:hypothetical protein